MVIPPHISWFYIKISFNLTQVSKCTFIFFLHLGLKSKTAINNQPLSAPDAQVWVKEHHPHHPHNLIYSERGHLFKRIQTRTGSSGPSSSSLHRARSAWSSWWEPGSSTCRRSTPSWAPASSWSSPSSSRWASTGLQSPAASGRTCHTEEVQFNTQRYWTEVGFLNIT